ncbi:hypothetical protein VXE65_20325 [Mycolicibacterium conceptionense]|uniref:hypothetical protein n=1 Tax=Mycolicibacterium conceptionense TaxID=451644 RepID=UPI003204C640
MNFTAGQRIRVQLPLRPDLHVDLVRHQDGWRRIDGDGPRVPYKDHEVSRCTWAPISGG